MVIWYIILSNCYVENHFNIVNKFRRCKMKRTYQPKKDKIKRTWIFKENEDKSWSKRIKSETS